MNRWASVACIVAVAAFVWSANAQRSRSPVLHEDVPSPAGARRSDGEARAIGAEPVAGRNPAAIAAGDKLLPEPKPDPSGKGEPVHGTSSFAVDRQTEWTPDRNTGMDGTLRYVEVFNPSVVPFKRMSAMDGIEADYTLVTRPSARVDVEVGGSPRADHDAFWGSLMVELSPGREAAIPSVAPDMRILSYETEPRTSIIFSRDGAGNTFVRTDEPGSARVYRLTFLVDAPATYFAPFVDPDLRVADIPPGMVSPLPASVAPSARRAVRKLGIEARMPVRDALDRLTRYFRAFEDKPLPRTSGDVFWDLFEAQAGVCRHRSFAFMVTATAAGIPTRYLTNEAHAWVEVWAPRSGWMRVDLGGAALALEVSGGSGKSMHRPRADDPFAKPRNYLETYSRLEGEVSGLSPSQLAEARAPIEAASTGGDTLGQDAEGAEPSPSTPPRGPMAPGPGSGPAQDPEPDEPAKEPVFVTITAVQPSSYRGEGLAVDGRVSAADGSGLGGLAVELFLAPAGTGGEDARWVGHTVTTRQGGFSITVPVPPDLTLGDYEVYVSTAGNDRYRSAVSE